MASLHSDDYDPQPDGPFPWRLIGVLLVLLALVMIGAGISSRFSDPGIRIMSVGDSITAGYTDRSWNAPFSFGYRSHLYKLLNQNGCKFQFVGRSPEPWRSDVVRPPEQVIGFDLNSVHQDHHRGYGGWRIADLTRWLPLWLLWDRPDVILFMAGVNDVGEGAADETLRSDITKAIETIQRWRPSAKLFVGTVTPAIHSRNPATARLNLFIINDLAKSHGFSVVDQSTPFADKDGKARPEMFANGMNHPTKDGYHKMAENWYVAIKDVACASSQPL